jgi:flagellar hook-length control protein FliK
VSPDVGNPQTGQLDQKSTGVAETQSHTDDAAVAYPTSLVQSAKLVERIGEAELRLGIRAGEFGSVDIRTSMVRNQFTAEISVERSELGRVLTAELPSLQNRLAEQRVQVANITVQNHTGSHSTASEQQKPRDGQQVYTANPISGQNEGLMPALVALEGTASESRLDVHM